VRNVQKGRGTLANPLPLALGSVVKEAGRGLNLPINHPWRDDVQFEVLDGWFAIEGLTEDRSNSKL
jgi:hypothetical protein